MDYGEAYQNAAMNSRAAVRHFPNPLARWGELQLQPDGKDATGISQVAADPAGVDMDRVVSTMHAVEQVESGHMPPDAAMKAVGEISQAPPGPTWLFALAAAAGAVALSVIFGVEHLYSE